MHAQPDTLFQARNSQKLFDKLLRNWGVMGVVMPPMANQRAGSSRSGGGASRRRRRGKCA
jgi:hypothetical protein